MNIAILATAAAAFWPVWQWYAQRSIDGSDEPLGLLALITLVGLIVFRTKTGALRAPVPDDGPALHMRDRVPTAAGKSRSLWLCAALLIAYCATWTMAPQLVHAILAIVVVGILLSQSGVVFMPADWVLLLLSLPLSASLNFYGGFPLRLLASNIAVPLLTIGGFHVIGRGTTIQWHDQLITIDQPCSGIKMLWLSIYLGATLASVQKRNFWQMLVLLIVAVAAALLTNALRITSLFLLATHQLHIDSSHEGSMHEAIGIASFALCALVIISTAFAMQSKGETAEMDVKIEDAEVSSLPATLKYKMPTTQSATVLALLVMAALMPMISQRAAQAEDAMQFPGWPTNVAGHQLQLAPELESALKAQLRFDPGRVAIFTDETNKRVYIIRWITHTSREVHSASDCYRAASVGDVNWLGVRKLDDSCEYSCFTATLKGADRPTLVCERIFDNQGHSYTDVSSWFWASMFEQTEPPWWSITIAERE